ncbi:DUF4238 domain-containing protein [Hyphomicrobium sp. ghe19]|uniref:DUF4238 domain-containing protein n=1 Tax=Hyphomicrobium sp. ghe19 TaxID=2682968 RepID=UPI0013675DC5|nr:hypothetical protein HYPP_01872 [Hyphomicrobium sp. ghe19]
MSTPIWHHYIPQFLQRNFLDERGKIHVFEKGDPNRRIRAMSPKSAFASEGLNTFRASDGTSNSDLEVWYSKFESKAALVVRKIVLAAEAGRAPRLSAEEKNLWDNFLYHQQKRAPNAFDRYAKDFEKDLPGFIEWFEREHRPLTEKERNDFQKPEVLEMLRQRAMVSARGMGGQEVVNILGRRGIAVGVITAPNRSFLLGDGDWARLGETGRLTDQKTELWTPIAHNVAVSPWGREGQERAISLDMNQVRTINCLIYENSNVVGARSPLLIRSLAGI